MRYQVKGVDGFAANPIRARLMISELERLVLSESPATGRFERYEHLSRYIAASKNNSDFVLPRRSFFKWKKGEALPNSSARANLDKLFFKERVGSAYGDRHCNSVEQTLLCALDLISSKAKSDKVICNEALEILSSIHASWKARIKSLVRLENPKLTDYKGLSKPKRLNRNDATSRLEQLSKLPVAYPKVAARFSSYDLTTHFDVLISYLAKPNNSSDLSKEARYCISLDIISSAICSYIVMLFQNTEELYTGGLMVERYRLVFNDLFNCSNKRRNHYLSNNHPDISNADHLYGTLLGSLEAFTEKAGLSRQELLDIVSPIDPNKPKHVESWFLN